MGSKAVQITCAEVAANTILACDNERLIGGRVPESLGLGPLLATTEMLAVTTI
jgi:hypothetical protein